MSSKWLGNYRLDGRSISTSAISPHSSLSTCKWVGESSRSFLPDQYHSAPRGTQHRSLFLVHSKRCGLWGFLIPPLSRHSAENPIISSPFWPIILSPLPPTASLPIPTPPNTHHVQTSLHHCFVLGRHRFGGTLPSSYRNHQFEHRCPPLYRHYHYDDGDVYRHCWPEMFGWYAHTSSGLVRTICLILFL